MRSRPRGDRPPWMTGGLLKMPAESAKALGQEWVRVTSTRDRPGDRSVGGTRGRRRKERRTHSGRRARRTCGARQANFRAGELCEIRKGLSARNLERDCAQINAPLDAEQRRDLAVGRRVTDLLRRRRERKRVAVLLDQQLGDVDLLERVCRNGESRVRASATNSSATRTPAHAPRTALCAVRKSSEPAPSLGSLGQDVKHDQKKLSKRPCESGQRS